MVTVERVVEQAYGRCFAVEASPSVLSRLRTELPFGGRPSPRAPERTWRIVEDGDGTVRASVDDTVLGESADVEAMVRVLASDLELWVAEHAEGLVFVHAGVVAVQGKAVLLPGLTRSGKSTLTAALVRAGAEYYSDDMAPLDAQGRVHAYRRPPKQRPDSPAAGWGLRLPVPGSPEPPPVPVALVATVRFEPQAALAVEDVPAAAAVLHLMSNTVAARSRPVEALDTLTLVTATARRLEGTRGDAEEAAHAILAELAAHVR